MKVSARRGDEIVDLRSKTGNLPKAPGVYLFKDKDGRVIYVGKAISLKNRVRQYFQSGKAGPRTRAMVERAAGLEYIVTDSEVEALVLECNLIKEYRPRYNVCLKDDKSYPYLKVTLAEDFPRVFLTRRLAEDGSRYFGPYTRTGAVNETLSLLRRIFPLRTCPGRDLKLKGRPCLNYHIKHCLGPCCGLVGKEQYLNMVEEVCQFLEGKQGHILKRLACDMEQAAQELRFERAAILRDQIRSIEELREKQKVSLPDAGDRDVVAVANYGEKAVVTVFYVRSGRMVGRDNFSLASPEGLTEAELLTGFLKQFYLDSDFLPPEVVVPSIAPGEIPALVKWLSSRRGGKIKVTVPRRGEKLGLVSLAAKNAALALEEEKIQESGEKGVLEALASVLGLPAVPHRLEGYDISHISGTQTVGVMVVFTGGRKNPGQYRRFKIENISGPDDFASMAEVLRRRLARARDQDPKFLPLPGLILIDGGRGQLSAAKGVLEEYNLDIPCASLAKKEELIFTPGESEPLRLPAYSPVLKLLQRVRDESHRFAITYHRKRRGKAALESLLEQVPGVGKARRKALLEAFHTPLGVSQAEVEELARVPGMNRAVAQNVYNFFKDERK